MVCVLVDSCGVVYMTLPRPEDIMADLISYLETAKGKPQDIFMNVIAQAFLDYAIAMRRTKED